MPATIRNRPAMNTAVRPLWSAASGNANAKPIPTMTVDQMDPINHHFEPESWSAAPLGNRRRR
jgi:hypothetical protein